MFEFILKVSVLFFDRNLIGKLDIEFFRKYVLLIRLVFDYILVFENGGDVWKKIILRVDLFFLKSFVDIFFLLEEI